MSEAYLVNGVAFYHSIRDEAKDTERWAAESGLSHADLIAWLEDETRAHRFHTDSGFAVRDLIAELNRREARHQVVRRWVIGTGIAVAVVSLMITAQVIAHSVAAGL